MGTTKYLKQVEEFFQKSPVVDVNSISRIMNNKKKVKQYNKQLIRNLVLKGRIKRLTKGFYTTHDDPSLAVFCFSPAYLGLQDALSLHNLWEQETIPVIITAKRIRPGIRKILGANVLIRRVNKKYLFGSVILKQGDFYFPYSDIEKTFIDMIYFKERLSKEAITEIRKKVNVKKLNKYLENYPKRIKKIIFNLLK